MSRFSEEKASLRFVCMKAKKMANALVFSGIMLCTKDTRLEVMAFPTHSVRWMVKGYQLVPVTLVFEENLFEIITKMGRKIIFHYNTDGLKDGHFNKPSKR